MIETVVCPICGGNDKNCSACYGLGWVLLFSTIDSTKYNYTDSDFMWCPIWRNLCE